MTDFETRLREIAAQSPGMAVSAAVKFADARAAGQADPLPDPSNPVLLAAWASQHISVMENLPHKPINAIKELRAVGHGCGMPVSLRDAKDAIDVLRQELHA